jgi:hypothetical protein
MYGASANKGFSAVRGAEGVREELTGSKVVVGARLAAAALRPCFLLARTYLWPLFIPF